MVMSGANPAGQQYRGGYTSRQTTRPKYRDSQAITPNYQEQLRLRQQAAGIDPLVRSGMRSTLRGYLPTRNQQQYFHALNDVGPKVRDVFLRDLGWNDDEIGELERRWWTGGPETEGGGSNWLKASWNVANSIGKFLTDYESWNPAEINWGDVNARLRGFGQGALARQDAFFGSTIGPHRHGQPGQSGRYEAPPPATTAQAQGQLAGDLAYAFMPGAGIGNIHDAQGWEIGAEIAGLTPFGAATKTGHRIFTAGTDAARSGLGVVGDARVAAQGALHDATKIVPRPKPTSTSPLQLRRAVEGEEVADARWGGQHIIDDERATLTDLQIAKKVDVMDPTDPHSLPDVAKVIEKDIMVLDASPRLPRERIVAESILARGEQLTVQRELGHTALYPGQKFGEAFRKTAQSVVEEAPGTNVPHIVLAEAADVKRAMTEAGPLQGLIREGVDALQESAMRFLGAGGQEVGLRWRKTWEGLRGSISDQSTRKARRLQRAIDSILNPGEGQTVSRQNIRELTEALRVAGEDTQLGAILRRKAGRSEQVQKNFNEVKALSKFLTQSAQRTFDYALGPAGRNLRNALTLLPTRTSKALRAEMESVATILEDAENIVETVSVRARNVGRSEDWAKEEIAKLDDAVKEGGGWKAIPEDMKAQVRDRKAAIKATVKEQKNNLAAIMKTLDAQRAMVRGRVGQAVKKLGQSKLSKAQQQRLLDIMDPFRGATRVTGETAASGIRKASSAARGELPPNSMGGEIQELLQRMNDTPSEFFKFQRSMSKFNNSAVLERAVRSALSRSLRSSNVVKLVFDKAKEMLYEPGEELFAFADRALANIDASKSSALRPSEFYTGPARAFDAATSQWDIKGQVLAGGLKFEARNSFNNKFELAAKMEAIKNHPKMAGDMERQGEALLAMLTASRMAKLTRKEIGLLGEVFGADYARSLLKLEKLDSKAFETFSYIYNAPKGIMAVMDASGFLRQGLIPTTANPQKFPERLNQAIRAMADEEYAGALLKDRMAHPKWGVFKASGGELADFSRKDDVAGMSEIGEELFGRNLAHDVPIFGDLIARPSDRSYAALLSVMRFDWFIDQTKAWEEPVDGLLSHMPGLGRFFKAPEPVSFATDPQRYRDLMAVIHASTGRSTMLDFMRGGFADRVMNLAFWAPRLALSRFEVPMQLLGISEGGLKFRSTSWAVRRALAKELVKSSMTIGGILGAVKYLGKEGGVDVSANPGNSDFGRIRIQGYQPSDEEKDAKARELYPEFDGFLSLSDPRKEDVLRELGARKDQTVFDMLGGYGQPIRFVFQTATGKGVPLTGGESFDINRFDPLKGLLRSKMHPLSGTLLSVGTGTSYSGEEVEALDQWIELSVPLVGQEINQLVESYGVTGMMLSTAPFFGIGTQNFTTPGLERERISKQYFNSSFEALDEGAQRIVRNHADVNEAKAHRKPSETDERRKAVNTEAENQMLAAADAMSEAIGFGNPDLTQKYRDSRRDINSKRAVKLAEIEIQRNGGVDDEIEIPDITEKPEQYAYRTWLSFFVRPVGQGGVMQETGQPNFDELNRLMDQLYQDIEANHIFNGGPTVTQVRKFIHDEAGITPLTYDDAGNPHRINESYDGARDWLHSARWYSWEMSDFIETDFTVMMREVTGNQDLQLESFWSQIPEEYQEEYTAFAPIYRQGGKHALRTQLRKIGPQFTDAAIDQIAKNIDYINSKFDEEKDTIMENLPEVNMVMFQFYGKPLMSLEAQAMGWAVDQQLGNSFWGTFGKVFRQPMQNERVESGVVSALIGFDNGSIQSLEDLARANWQRLAELPGLSRDVAYNLVRQAAALIEELERQREARRGNG